METLFLALLLQVHPCSQPDQFLATAGTKYGWCAPDADVSATWTVKIDGVVYGTPSAMPPVGSPDPANGLYYFEIVLPTGYPVGNHTITVQGSNESGTGPVSNAAVWKIGAPPSKPSKPRIVP